MKRLVVTLAVVAGCGDNLRPASDAAPDTAPACVTTISGTVTAPNGTLPLFGVTVYVPGSDPGPLPATLACRACGEPPGGAVALTRTGVDGGFSLAVPAGADPLVIQVGKWRRRLAVTAAACADTPLPADDTRLPSSAHDATALTSTDATGAPEVDLPHIAISTGVSDAIECLALQIGIDPSEFTTDAGDGHVHMYTNYDVASGPGMARGADHFMDGTMFGDAEQLWSNLDSLSRYDLVMLGCEGDTFPATKPQASLDAMKQYADAGGRLFVTHLQRLWLTGEPAWAPLATFDDDVVTNGNAAPLTVEEVANPSGPSYAEWLVDSGASAVRDTVYVDDAHAQCTAVVDPAVAWLTIQPSDQTELQQAVELFDVATPVEQPGARCGEVIYADPHVAYGSLSDSKTAFPLQCSQEDLFPQAKAIAFLLFDLTGCPVPATQ